MAWEFERLQDCGFVGLRIWGYWLCFGYRVSAQGLQFGVWRQGAQGGVTWL